MDSRIKIGVYGIGLDTYWPQFEGLEPRWFLPSSSTHIGLPLARR